MIKVQIKRGNVIPFSHKFYCVIVGSYNDYLHADGQFYPNINTTPGITNYGYFNSIEELWQLLPEDRYEIVSDLGKRTSKMIDPTKPLRVISFDTLISPAIDAGPIIHPCGDRIYKRLSGHKEEIRVYSTKTGQIFVPETGVLCNGVVSNTPQPREWTINDVPKGYMEVKLPNWAGSETVLSKCINGIRIRERTMTVSFEQLKSDGFLWSSDGINWKPCAK